MTPEKTVTCDRYGRLVALTRVTVTGNLDHPEEAVCRDCTTPEDRII